MNNTNNHNNEFNLSSSTIRSYIPVHCFKICTLTSLYYFFKDVAIIISLYILRFQIEILYFNSQVYYSFSSSSSSSYDYLYLLFVSVWSLITGFFFWCLFVIGHDCGHQLFSPSPFINDLIGILCHSPLLVSYHGWKLSHLHHHSNHNNIDEDRPWKPITKDRYLNDWVNQAKNNYIKLLFYFARYTFVAVLLFPFYLISEGPYFYTSGNHFNPYSRLYNGYFKQGLISVTSVILFAAILLYNWRLSLLLHWYIIPYVIFTMWLSIVTYLHHTHHSLTYFNKSGWTYMKGALLGTINRIYFNSFIEELHHSIGSGHTVHHLFFKSIPHYHLNEATLELSKHAPRLIQFDNSNPLLYFFYSQNKFKYLTENGIMKNSFQLAEADHSSRDLLLLNIVVFIHCCIWHYLWYYLILRLDHIINSLIVYQY